MSSPELRVVDVEDAADLHAWWATGHRAGLADRPYDAWPPWELARRALPRPREDQRIVLLAARLAGEQVGSALVVLPLLDNTHTARLDVQVDPAARRRGVGTALLAAAEAVAAREGRRTLLGEAFAPRAGTSPGLELTRHRGWTVVEENAGKLLDLRAAAARWGPLDAEVAAHLGGHRVLTCTDRVPDEHVEGVCAVLSVFVGMLPPSERDAEETVWDAARLRAGEARDAANGRRQVRGVALDRDGRVVGLSDVRVDSPAAPVAGVGITLVLPAHRGHRLGLALKLATHRALVGLRDAGRVACTHVETQNATVNAPMNRVDEALGYEVAERALDLQKVAPVSH